MMRKPIRVSTPQFQAKLIRKMKNVVPSCSIEFVEVPDSGIAFRLKDRQGRYRTNLVRIYRYHEKVLHREDLVQRIRSAGEPQAGFPRGL